MPTFIKPGFWEKKQKGYDHWLNLDQLITSLSPPAGGVTSIIAGTGISIDQATGNVTISSAINPQEIIPQVQLPSIEERQNIDIYNGVALPPLSSESGYMIPNYVDFKGDYNGDICIIFSKDWMLRSIDGGLTWNSIVLDIFSQGSCAGVKYIGNDTFIATFSGGIIYSNDNGLSWKSSIISTNSTDFQFIFPVSAPAFLNVGEVPTIVVGINTSIFYSIDSGVTFIEKTMSSSISPAPLNITSSSNLRVNASNGYFFAYNTIATNIFLYSSDGITWNYSAKLPGTLIIKDIIFNNSRYFINQSSTNSCFYTTDFNTITNVARLTSSMGALNQNAFVANNNVAISIGNDILISYNNGDTWVSLFDDNGLTVFSSIIVNFFGNYGWFDGTRFNILCYTLGQTLLLYDADGTGTSWSVSPIEDFSENFFPNPMIFSLLSPTRYILSILTANGKILVKDTPLNGVTNVTVCQSGTSSASGNIGSPTLDIYNFRYTNGIFVNPLLSSGYVSISSGSDPTVKWTKVPVKTTSSQYRFRKIRGLYYENGYWIAVGSPGIISTSPDLENWTINPSTQATSNGEFSELAAIGTIGVILPTNNNNIVWTSSNIGTTPFLSNTLSGLTGVRYIATNGNIFVVCSFNNASIAYSSDGLTWNYSTLFSTSTTVAYLTYLNGKFIACHTYGISSSEDGINWTSSFTSLNGISTLKCVYTGTYWVAICSNHTIMRSTDLINWSFVYNNQLVSIPSVNMNNIVSDGIGNIIAGSSSQNAYFIMVSNDHGLNWRAVSPAGIKNPGNIYIYVTYGNGYFVCSIGGYIYCSNDGGNTWNLNDFQNESIEYPSNGGGAIKKVNNKYFVFNSMSQTQLGPQYSPGMRVADSINGIYTKCKTGLLFGGAVIDITSDGTNYIATCTGNKILKSIDGEYFTDVSPVVPFGKSGTQLLSFTFAEYANDIFLVGGTNGMLYKSTTGNYGSWINVTSFDMSYLFTNAAYGNGRWVVVGILNAAPLSSNKIFISSDNGDTWTNQTFNYIAGFLPTFLRFFNGYFYLGGNLRNIVLRSSDGINWKSINVAYQSTVTAQQGNFYTLEQDSATGYLYLYAPDAIFVSIDNGLTFNRTAANPFIVGITSSTTLSNYRQIVENGYLYVSSFAQKSFTTPYEIIGLPIS